MGGSSKRSRSKGKFAALIVSCIALVCAVLAYRSVSGRETPQREKQVSSPAPVSVAVAEKSRLSIYATGLGTVQASSTITIRSQVDGKLQEVTFTEGGRVKKGDVLAKIDPRLFRAARDAALARKAQDVTLLTAAEKDLVRSKTLAQSNFQTQQTLDQQQAKVDQLKAVIAADDAAIESAQTQLDYATITSPIDGLVGTRKIDPGNLVHASDSQPIAVLMDVQTCAVLFTLPSRNFNDLREALARGEVRVEAYDQEDRSHLSSGKLLPIGDAIDQSTDTIHLKAMFANQDEKLWPGEFVNARIMVKSLDDVLTVPSSAVQRGPQGLFVWVITPKDTAEPHSVQVGAATDEKTVIESGINAGDRVVTDGQYKLKRNAKVLIRPAVSTPHEASR